MCCKETLQFCNFSVNILRIKLKHLTSSWHSEAGYKLAKSLFFISHSQLCRHCNNLAKGGCLLL